MFRYLKVTQQRSANFLLVLLIVVLDNVWHNMNCCVSVKSVVFMDYVCLENVLVCLSDGLFSLWRICEMTRLPLLVKYGPVMVL